MTSIVRHVYVDGQRVEVPAGNPGVSASPRMIHTGGIPAQVSGDGTDATPSVTEAYFAEIYVPAGVTATGIALFNGSAVAGNVTLGLYDAAGNFLGKSASTAQAGTDTYQLVPLATALALTTGTYYVAAQFNNTGARFNTHTFGAFGAGKLTGQTYGTMPSGLTMPTTFTTALGPIASLY